MTMPMFSRSGNPIRLLRRMPDVRKREKSKINVYLGFYIHNSNEIPTAVHMFSTLGNTIRLLRRMLDVRKGKNQRWRLRYALFHIYFRLLAAIFDLSTIRTSGILRSTSFVLPDLENMGIAVGISLLLRTQPKIQVLYMYFRFMATILIVDMDFCHLLSLLSAATLLSWKTKYRSLYRLPLVFYISWYDDVFFSKEFICRPDFKFQNFIKFIIFIYFTENLQKSDEYIMLIMNQQTRMTKWLVQSSCQWRVVCWHYIVSHIWPWNWPWTREFWPWSLGSRPWPRPLDFGLDYNTD